MGGRHDENAGPDDGRQDGALVLARLGLTVTGLDISETFAEIAKEHARRECVPTEFRVGDAASLPFEANSFDLVVCQAAFKSFGHPEQVLGAMHRVLRPGGTVVIQDINRDATNADIAREVRDMDLNALNSFPTKIALRGLRRRAYSRAEFERLAAASAFGGAECTTDGITLEVRLVKR